MTNLLTLSKRKIRYFPLFHYKLCIKTCITIFLIALFIASLNAYSFINTDKPLVQNIFGSSITVTNPAGTNTGLVSMNLSMIFPNEYNGEGEEEEAEEG